MSRTLVPRYPCFENSFSAASRTSLRLRSDFSPLCTAAIVRRDASAPAKLAKTTEVPLVASSINSSDTAWLLIATALVLMMTPALGFFYGGMVRAKNALNTLMMSFSALGFVGLAWAFLGYSVAFGHSSTWCGGGEFFFLRGVGLGAQGTIPHLLFFAYQGTFAIITAALISGAIVERMRFGPYIAFITLWSLLVYAPIAHWVWGGGWIGKLGALDFAGGTVVHVNAAAAALVCALVVGSRKDYARTAMLPQNVPFTLLGAGLLWLRRVGFNPRGGRG